MSSLMSSLVVCLLSAITLGCDDEESRRAEDPTSSGAEAGESSEPAGESAGELAGDLAGELAGDLAGDLAGESAGESAGEEVTPALDPAELNLTGCDPSVSNLELKRSLTGREDRTEIHPHAVWDGDAFWIAWNIANAESKFETWAGRFGCDLEPLIEPFALDQTPGMNDLDPSVAVSGDVVVIMWARDDSFSGGGSHNLSTQLAALDRSTGEPLAPVRPLLIDVSDARTPSEAIARAPEQVSEGNMWMPSVVTHPDGGFIVSGAWGSEARNTFLVYLQHLDASGAELGSAWLADPEGANQNYPEVSVSPYGVIDLTWSGDGVNGQSGIWGRSWRADVEAPLTRYGDDDTLTIHTMRSPHLGYAEGLVSNPPQGDDLGEPWRAMIQGAGFSVETPEGSLGRLAPARPFLGVRFAPQLLIGYQRLQGNASDLWWRPLNADGWGESTLLSEEDNPAAPYPLTAAPLQGGTLVVWAAGSNPEFKLQAKFIGASQ